MLALGVPRFGIAVSYGSVSIELCSLLMLAYLPPKHLTDLMTFTRPAAGDLMNGAPMLALKQSTQYFVLLLDIQLLETKIGVPT